MNGWMDGRTDGWMDDWMDGQMDGWMDESDIAGAIAMHVFPSAYEYLSPSTYVCRPLGASQQRDRDKGLW